jgi:hypothetical protein
LFGITIGGNFVCTRNAGACTAISGSVALNLQITNNASPAAVGTNDVGGNAQINNNNGSFPTAVFNNAISGNLQCNGNVPGVSMDFANVVAGSRQLQCAESSS